MGNDPFVHLLISLWDCPDPVRRGELLACLQRNRANPRIERIHVFVEAGCDSWKCELQGERIEIVNHEGYPSFATFIDYANRRLAGEVVAIANTDIYFDASLELLREQNLDREVFALTRHNEHPYMSWNGRCWERNYGSQDVWIFRAPLPPVSTDARPGWFGCDGLLARDLQVAGIRVRNPSGDIKAWHVHAQRPRVTDLFAHPKSHYHGNVDPITRHQFGFRFLPIEPLGKWKLYTVYSESHDTLFQKWFLGTMQDDFEVISRRIDQTCRAASYMTEGWGTAVSQKIPLILEAIDAHTENGFFIFSDVDVQWLGPVEGRLRRHLAEHPSVDIFFQSDAQKDPGGHGNICTGFFVCKGNIRTRAFWTLVGERMRRHGKGDQITSQQIIRSNAVRGLNVGTLPEEFWGPGSGLVSPLRWKPGMFLDPPPNLLVHHANWTVGVANKAAQLEYIARKVRLWKTRQSLSAEADPSPIDHWTETRGSSPPSSPAAAPQNHGGRSADPLLMIAQSPRKLPGEVWGVCVAPTAANALESGQWRAFVQSARAQGLKIAAVDLSGPEERAREAEPAADRTIRAAPTLAGQPPGRAAILAAALREIPETCDKIAWLETFEPLEGDWSVRAISLLERYEFVQFRRAGSAEMPGAASATSGVHFKEAVFGPAEIRRDLALPSPTGLAWAARRESLEAAKFSASPASAQLPH